MLLLLVLACASGDSCSDFVQARNDCSESAGSSDRLDATELCAGWTAEQESTYGDWYECQMRAYTQNQCDTTDDLYDAKEGASLCTEPMG